MIPAVAGIARSVEFGCKAAYEGNGFCVISHSAD